MTPLVLPGLRALPRPGDTPEQTVRRATAALKAWMTYWQRANAGAEA